MEITHQNQANFMPRMQGWLNTPKPINALHHINRLKNRSHTIILTDTKKDH